jgi:hypothetical protein
LSEAIELMLLEYAFGRIEAVANPKGGIKDPNVSGPDPSGNCLNLLSYIAVSFTKSLY